MSKPIEIQPEFIAVVKELTQDFAKIKSMRPLPKDAVKYFINEFAISTSLNSNAIEGNTFSYNEAKLLIERGVVSSVHSFREHLDIIGYKQAFDCLYKAVREKRPIDEDFIKKIHSYVLLGSEEAGEYRTVQNYIGNMVRTVYTPCAPKEVPLKMADYVRELNKDFEYLSDMVKHNDIDWYRLFQTLAKHHIEFERIHPFIDGNGRTGRLLLTYEMILLGLLPVDIRYEERERYYAAISAYEGKDKYSTRPESKTEKMAKLLAESELQSMTLWLKTFADYVTKN